MKRIQAFLTNKNMLLRMILSYLMVGLLVIVMLTFVIASKVSGDLTEEINRSADTAIEQSYNTASIVLSSTFDNFGSVFGSADIQVGFYDEDFDTSTLGRIGNKLYALSASNPLVHSIYLLNSQRKLAFSSLSTVRDFDEFYDRGALALLENLQPNRSGIFTPRHIHYAIDGKSDDRNLISVVLPNAIGQATNGALVLNLDQRTLQRMVMNGSESRLFQSMILNKQGIVITHTNAEKINTNVAEQPFVRTISASASPKGTFQFKEEGRTYRVTYMKSDSLGWTFIGMIDYEQLLGKVQEMKRFILGVTGGMLVAVFLIGGFFTRWIYAPIHRLMTYVHHSPLGAKERQGGSELDLLGNTFHYLENKIRDLQWHVTEYQSAKRSEVIRLLLTGACSQEKEMRKKLAGVRIEFTDSCFAVAVLKLDHFRTLQETYTQADIDLFKYAVANIADELASSRVYCVCFDSGADEVSLIANFPEDAWKDQDFAAMSSDIQAKISEFLRLSVTVAVGPNVSQLAEVKRSWAAARNALRYRLVHGTGSYLRPDVEENRESRSDHLMASAEKLIMDQLKLGDLNKVREALEQYMGLIRSVPFDELMLALTQLLLSTAKAAKTMVGSEQLSSRMDIGTLMEQLGTWETLEEIERWYMGMCEQAVHLRDRQAQHKNKWIVDNILTYIHAHYAEPGLTIDQLVEAGGLSLNYTRKLFKDMTGQTITAYLSGYRFAKAQKLLVETDLPANRVGELVGFDNANYFYVSFKKHTGKSPDHYRKQHKFSANEQAASDV
ncbi:helix-turn-helix domain-containing protein [Paenibacillus whitsoniae]|uniref:Helix-turn-helix domain-containing protein n=1 Tax=Paenibacillus whitsoniae TaxID=2496558 RepID=A0A430J535_9BACL|nr:helix-turn-helix domain-containing protein [Paenibacillus whitsoniae]RTE01998.1 helix-turn-helix domain-containing protein [Paenibacillus whitsoniae]